MHKSLGITIALLLAGCSSPPPAPTPKVVISMGATEAASGLRVQTIEMTNVGDAPYTVKGYPAVQVVTKDEQPIELGVSHGSKGVSLIESFEVAPQTVTLQPGEKATSGMVWRNLVTDSTVRAKEGFFVDIAPVAGEPWQRTQPEHRIDLGNTEKLGVSPWARTAR